MFNLKSKDDNILLITKALSNISVGGRELLCKLNQNAIQDIYGNNMMLYEVNATQQHDIKTSIHALRGNIDGVGISTMDHVLKIINNSNVTKVFIDGSNLGVIVAAIKRQYPSINVSTFFHNVESRFFWGSFRQRNSIHALGVLIANYFAERKAVRYSDTIICLNDRDSALLKRIYGRSATHIAPMILEDQVPASYFENIDTPPEAFALFVGGAFYANQAGVEWFIREVTPKITIPLYIVGRGFEALRNQLEIPGKVIVVGEVDSLADWYKRAQFVVAPIFDGSGMKTKVAEALMYGKKIVGTKEAFTGYEDIIDQSGWLCETADEFIDTIAEVQVEIYQSYYPVLRKLYVERYSMPAGIERLKKILLE